VPRIPLRTVRVPDDLWEAAQAKAMEEGTTVSAVILAALRRFTRPPRTAKATAGR
jgi:ABC-type amino acid transport system permease subunit